MLRDPEHVQEPPAPRVSVIIPHLNEPENLARCLTALEAGRARGPSFEVIVADNGSPIPPQAVCDAFPGTHLVVELGIGPGPARNTGAAMARGDIICFIDADCFPAPDCLAAYVAYFDAHPEVDFMGGPMTICPADPSDITVLEAYEAVFSYRIAQFVKKDNFAATGNMAVRTSVFRAVGPFDGIARHEDKVWGQKAVAQGFAIAYLPIAVVYTPGCADWRELAVRIQRHVAHDFTDLPEGWRARAKWFVRSLMVLVSPIGAIGETAMSPAIEGATLRLQVFLCLCAVRAYRAKLMMQMLLRDTSRADLMLWNREPAEIAQKKK